jgi:hypothetical protein
MTDHAGHSLDLDLVVSGQFIRGLSVALVRGVLDDDTAAEKSQRR